MAGSVTGPRPADSAERAAIAIGVAVVLVVYALRGATYDIVPRGEAGIAIWWVLGLGAALGLLPRRRPTWPAWIVIGALAGLVAWTALGFGWTGSSERTSIELARVVHHAGLLLLALCLIRPSAFGAAVGGAAAAGAVICGIALASRLWPGTFPVDRVGAAFETNRLNYPLNYWNGVAAWGAMATAMNLAWAAHARRLVLRALAAAAVPLCVTVVYLTYSRAGAGGVAVAAVVALLAARTRAVMAVQLVVSAIASYLVITAVRSAPEIARATGSAGSGGVLAKLLAAMAVCALVAMAVNRLGADDALRWSRERARVGFAVAAMMVAVAGAAVLPPVVNRAVDQFNDNGPRSASVDPAARLGTVSGNRHNLWNSALDAYRVQRSHGTGPGTFEFWWNQDAVDREHVRDAHSLFLEALAEMGWPGLLLVLTLCGGALHVLLRTRRSAQGRSSTGAASAALGAFCVWLVAASVDWMWEETAVTALALLLVGAASATLGGSRRRWGWPARAGIVALAVLGILVQLPPTVGTSLVRKSAEALNRDDSEQARAAAADAARAWPWAATPRAQQAQVADSVGDYEAARAYVEKAQRREPESWRHPLLAARIALEQGRVRDALQQYARAIELRPLGSFARR